MSVMPRTAVVFLVALSGVLSGCVGGGHVAMIYGGPPSEGYYPDGAMRPRSPMAPGGVGVRLVGVRPVERGMLFDVLVYGDSGPAAKEVAEAIRCRASFDPKSLIAAADPKGRLVTITPIRLSGAMFHGICWFDPPILEVAKGPDQWVYLVAAPMGFVSDHSALFSLNNDGFRSFAHSQRVPIVIEPGEATIGAADPLR